MNTRISHSSIRLYSSCGRRYKYHYVDKLRAKTISGALLFGSAIDTALNHLIKSKNLDEAESLFERSFRQQDINNISTYLPTAAIVVYGAKDFDEELLTPNDEFEFSKIKQNLKINSELSLIDSTNQLIELKKEIGFKNFTNEQKIMYNFGNWACLKNKGLYMLTGYKEQILPKIKQVLAIQKNVNLNNVEGDTITAYLDLVVEWEDGKRYILDNKTSSVEYDKNSAGESQQLILYYHMTKEEFSIDGGVGFIVLYKQLNKNRTKFCKSCNFNGTGGRFKTCSNEIEGKRCNGEWNEVIKPEARIQIVLNEVTAAAESLVIEAFDEANQGIKKEVFNPNLSACGTNEWRCPYYDLCWSGKSDDLVKVEKK